MKQVVYAIEQAVFFLKMQVPVVISLKTGCYFFTRNRQKNMKMAERVRVKDSICGN